jgi:hypothetical protein
MNSINNSVDIALLQTNRSDQTTVRTVIQGQTGRSGPGSKESQTFPPNIVNDTLGHVLKNLQFANNIKDTTGEILAAMQAQMDGKGIKLANLNQESVTSKSLQVGQALSLQGAQGLVQTNKDILRQFQG